MEQTRKLVLPGEIIRPHNPVIVVQRRLEGLQLIADGESVVVEGFDMRSLTHPPADFSGLNLKLSFEIGADCLKFEGHTFAIRRP